MSQPCPVDEAKWSPFVAAAEAPFIFRLRGALPVIEEEEGVHAKARRREEKEDGRLFAQRRDDATIGPRRASGPSIAPDAFFCR